MYSGPLQISTMEICTKIVGSFTSKPLTIIAKSQTDDSHAIFKKDDSKV